MTTMLRLAVVALLAISYVQAQDMTKIAQMFAKAPLATAKCATEAGLDMASITSEIITKQTIPDTKQFGCFFKCMMTVGKYITEAGEFAIQAIQTATAGAFPAAIPEAINNAIKECFPQKEADCDSALKAIQCMMGKAKFGFAM